MPLGIEKEERVLVLTGDANISFVAGGGVAEGSFVAEVEDVAVVSGGLRVVEDGLIAEGHAEDWSEDLRGLASRKGKGDVEGQHQAQHVGRTMEAGEVDGRAIRSGRSQLRGLKVVFAILIAQLELGGAELLEELFFPVQCGLLLPVVRTARGRAFVNGAVSTLLPAEKRAVAVGAPVRSLEGAEGRSEGGEAATNLAAQLARFAAIVGVEELAGCAAMGTATGARQGICSGALNRRQRSVMLAFVLFPQLPPVPSAGGCGRLGQGSPGIDREVAVMRMLLAKVVTRLRLGLTTGEDLLQLLDEFLQIFPSEFPAEPEHQSWYVAHGGEPLGNLAGSWQAGLAKREFTAFFLCRQVSHPGKARSDSRARRVRRYPSILAHRHRKGGESRNLTFRRQLNDLPAFRTEVFDRTATPKEMLRMKEPPGMNMKTKERRQNV